MCAVLIEIKGRTVTSPFKNNLLKQESLKFTSFCMPECCFIQLLKVSQINSVKMSTALLVWCELIKFLEFQGLGNSTMVFGVVGLVTQRL